MAPPVKAPRRSGTSMLVAGSLVSQAAALLRYALLAWWLGPEQLGLAAMLILTSQFFEQLTEVGLDRFLIQSAAGNTRSAGRAVHSVIVLRGFAIAAALALSSGLIARFFDHADLSTGLMVLAIAPAIQGWQNLDFRRVQRHHRFGGEGLVTLVGEVASLAVLLIAVFVTKSYVAIAFALIGRAVAQVVVSHAIARRPYRLGMPGRHRVAMMRFGLPLMANGLLLFLGGQGDRIVVGHELGAESLGRYSAVMLLIFYPAAILGRILQSLFLPLLSGARGEPQRSQAAIDRLACVAVLLATAMAIGFVAVAPFAVPLIYGRSFAVPAALICGIGVLQAIRFTRFWPATVALSQGRNTNLVIAGTIRLAAFPLALLLAHAGHGLTGIVGGFVVAEVLAMVFALHLLHRKGLGAARRDALRLLGFAAACAGLVMIVVGGGAERGAGVLVVLVAVASLLRRDRAHVGPLVQMLRTRLPRARRVVAAT